MWRKLSFLELGLSLPSRALGIVWISPYMKWILNPGPRGGKHQVTQQGEGTGWSVPLQGPFIHGPLFPCPISSRTPDQKPHLQTLPEKPG